MSVTARETTIVVHLKILLKEEISLKILANNLGKIRNRKSASPSIWAHSHRRKTHWSSPMQEPKPPKLHSNPILHLFLTKNKKVKERWYTEVISIRKKNMRNHTQPPRLTTITSFKWSFLRNKITTPPLLPFTRPKVTLSSSNIQKIPASR